MSGRKGQKRSQTRIREGLQKPSPRDILQTRIPAAANGGADIPSSDLLAPEAKRLIESIVELHSDRSRTYTGRELFEANRSCRIVLVSNIVNEKRGRPIMR